MACHQHAYIHSFCPNTILQLDPNQKRPLLGSIIWHNYLLKKILNYLIMTNLWINTQIGSIPNEFWYVDYQKGLATKSNQKPQFESIMKIDISIEQFLEERNFKVTSKNEIEVNFEGTDKFCEFY